MLDAALVSGAPSSPPSFINEAEAPLEPGENSKFLTFKFHINLRHAQESVVRKSRREFIEDMEKMARWMAKSRIIVTNSDGAIAINERGEIHTKSYINRPLQKVLINAIRDLCFEAFISETPLGGHFKKKENEIYVLRPADHVFIGFEKIPVRENGINVVIDVLEFYSQDSGKQYVDAYKPQKGRILFWRDGDRWGIPHPDGFIPFEKLDKFNVQGIPGAIGKAIREAFFDGTKDADNKDLSKPVIKREAAITKEDSHDVQEAIDQHPTYPRVRKVTTSSSVVVGLSMSRQERYRLIAQQKAEEKAARIAAETIIKPASISRERVRLEASQALLKLASEAAVEVAQRAAAGVIKKATAATELAIDVGKKERIIETRIKLLESAPKKLADKAALATNAENRAKLLAGSNPRNARSAMKIAERTRGEIAILAEWMKKERAFQESRTFKKECATLNADNSRLSELRRKAIDAAQKIVVTQLDAIAADQRYRKAVDELTAHQYNFGDLDELPEYQIKAIWSEVEKSLKRQKAKGPTRISQVVSFTGVAESILQPPVKDVINNVLRTGMTSKTYCERARRGNSHPRPGLTAKRSTRKNSVWRGKVPSFAP
jgi:hypothetical protein